MDKYVLDEARQPVRCNDVMVWGKWFESADDRVVGLHRMGDVRVSTVFLGLDHNFMHGEPILFETMVFGGEHDGAQWRYRNWKAAERGHEAVVYALMHGTALPN